MEDTSLLPWLDAMRARRASRPPGRAAEGGGLEVARDPSRALAALADPTRRRVFERLRGGPRAVGEIAQGLPVSRPAVSQHLARAQGRPGW